MRVLPCALASLCVLSALSAQVKPHERAFIKPLTGAFGNSGGRLDPIADSPRVDQHWFAGFNLPNPYIITETAARVDNSINTSTASTYKLTIVLENTKLGFSQLNPTPSKNLTTAAVTVFDAIVSYPSIAASTNPNVVHGWAKHTRPFVFRGPNLIVQRTLVSQPNKPSGARRVDGFNTKNISSFHARAGKTCGGQLAAAHTGTNYVVTANSVPASKPVILMFSAENVRLGALRLPIDLTPAGFTGCELGVVPQVFVPIAANASGIASLSVPFQIPQTSTLISVQALHPKGTSGWATTNVVNSVIGKAGLCNYLRVDKRGSVPPATANQTGLVLLVRGR